MCRLWPRLQGQDKRGLKNSSQLHPLSGSWRVNWRGRVRRGHLGPGLQHQDSSVGSRHMRVPTAGWFCRMPGWFVCWGLGFRPEAPLGDFGLESTRAQQGWV